MTGTDNTFSCIKNGPNRTKILSAFMTHIYNMLHETFWSYWSNTLTIVN